MEDIDGGVEDHAICADMNVLEVNLADSVHLPEGCIAIILDANLELNPQIIDLDLCEIEHVQSAHEHTSSNSSGNVNVPHIEADEGIFLARKYSNVAFADFELLNADAGHFDLIEECLVHIQVECEVLVHREEIGHYH